MKNIILSVLFWVLASAVMAIKLPAESFGSYDTYEYGNDSYTLGIGSTIMNTAVLGTASYQDGGCVVDPGTSADDVKTHCAECCNDNVFIPCIVNGGNEDSCGALHYDCRQACERSFSVPLGSALLLLPFALAYAVIRRRKEAVMA